MGCLKGFKDPQECSAEYICRRAGRKNRSRGSMGRVKHWLELRVVDPAIETRIGSCGGFIKGKVRKFTRGQRIYIFPPHCPRENCGNLSNPEWESEVSSFIPQIAGDCCLSVSQFRWNEWFCVRSLLRSSGKRSCCHGRGGLRVLPGREYDYFEISPFPSVLLPLTSS